MIIAIDFDGTCVTHEFPEMGKDIGAVPVLKLLIEQGHELILWTMRSDNPKRKHLTEAVKWFKDNDIPLYGINQNPKQGVWTSSPKAYAQLYIDDAALGCPLISDANHSKRRYVDWYQLVDYLLEWEIIIPPEEVGLSGLVEHLKEKWDGIETMKTLFTEEER